MEPENPRSTDRPLLTKLRALTRRAAVSAVGGVLGAALLAQSAAAQEGIQAVAEEFCVGQIASIASIGFYGMALASVIFGLLTFMKPKTDNGMSKRETRSNKVKGLSLMALGICAGAIPPILAGLGLVDVTTCVSPDNIGQ